MQVTILWQSFNQIGNLDLGGSGSLRDSFGYLYRHSPSIALPDQHYLDPIGIATDLRRVLAGSKITALHGVTAHQRFCGNVIVPEMINQAIAKLNIILQSFIQPLLLEDHLIVNAGSLV